ncbi:MAG: flagellar protein FlaG [Panacagrimonas sp.]
MSLEFAVSELNEHFSRRSELLFRVDEESGRLLVSVVDAQSGELLRQMPSEEALRIARMLDDHGARLIDGAA